MHYAQCRHSNHNLVLEPHPWKCYSPPVGRQCLFIKKSCKGVWVELDFLNYEHLVADWRLGFPVPQWALSLSRRHVTWCVWLSSIIFIQVILGVLRVAHWSIYTYTYIYVLGLTDFVRILLTLEINLHLCMWHIISIPSFKCQDCSCTVHLLPYWMPWHNAQLFEVRWSLSGLIHGSIIRCCNDRWCLTGCQKSGFRNKIASFVL